MVNPYVDPLEQSQWKINGTQLILGKKIGAGGCGWVYKGTLGGSGASVPIACKEVISATIDPDDLKEFKHEARMMTQLHHPYVITFYGVCEKMVNNEQTGEPEQRLYMVTELAPGGSLEGHIETAIKTKSLMASGLAKKNTKMPFDGVQMVKWALQIAAGMAHIHDRGFIHRDVKPQNVLLNGTGDALICDLGTVKNMEKYESYAEDEEAEYDMEAPVAMTKDLGTPLYMAPEQMRREAYSNAVDVWAYGIMMVRLFGLGDPFHSGITIKELKTQVSTNEIKPNTLDVNDLPHPGIKEVVEGCVEFRPGERYTFEQIEVKLAKILKEVEATSQQEKELRAFLKRHNIGRCYDKLVADGITSKEDLMYVTVEDLTGLGVKKFEARKVVAAFSSQP